MTTPNPLVPQGTFPEKGKSHVRIAVFTILAIHVVLLGALLIAGCKKTSDSLPGDGATNAYVPPPPFEPPVSLTPTSPPAPAANLVPPSTSYVPPQPPPTPPTPPEGATGMTEHTVVKGDSFYTLGKKYNVGWKTIAEANPGVDSARLKLGQKIKIPAPQPHGVTATANGAPSPSNGSEKTYVVKSGDNLMKIAKAHGVSLKALRAANANQLKTDQIKVGQKLIIPAKSALSPETAPAAVAPFSPPPVTPGPTNP